jgi:UDP-N-acetylglucosamine 1-carboxyvinyltransferase
MPELTVSGGRPLSGLVGIEGAKNAALPACVASLLTDEPIVLERIPDLRDVQTILATITSLGKTVSRADGAITITGGGPLHDEAESQFVRRMRASFLVLGPLLARLGRAVVPLPGGCTIGPRPVDLHLEGLRQLGARVEEQDSAVVVTTDGLRGAAIRLPYPSVGATEQLMIAATLATGETRIENAAQEPEITDLAILLSGMGAQIALEPGVLRIAGGHPLHGTRHRIIPDRIEAGTYLLAAAVTGGCVTVDDVLPSHLTGFLPVLEQAGATLDIDETRITATASGRPLPTHAVTAPHPGLATDLHPPLAALLSLATGESRISESVFAQRFGYVEPLRAMGACITVDASTAVITGVERLHASHVTAPDLRAGAALVLAGLSAAGQTTIRGIEHLERGYARINEKVNGLGGQIERTE